MLFRSFSLWRIKTNFFDGGELPSLWIFFFLLFLSFLGVLQPIDDRNFFLCVIDGHDMLMTSIVMDLFHVTTFLSSMVLLLATYGVPPDAPLHGSSGKG